MTESGSRSLIGSGFFHFAVEIHYPLGDYFAFFDKCFTKNCGGSIVSDVVLCETAAESGGRPPSYAVFPTSRTPSELARKIASWFPPVREVCNASLNFVPSQSHLKTPTNCTRPFCEGSCKGRGYCDYPGQRIRSPLGATHRLLPKLLRMPGRLRTRGQGYQSCFVEQKSCASFLYG